MIGTSAGARTTLAEARAACENNGRGACSCGVPLTATSNRLRGSGPGADICVRKVVVVVF
jgi:hypothetical protein